LNEIEGKLLGTEDGDADGRREIEGVEDGSTDTEGFSEIEGVALGSSEGTVEGKLLPLPFPVMALCPLLA
jgi:hypothetical protein